MITPCKHYFKTSNIEHYQICTECGTMNAIVPISDEIYLNDFWNPANGHSSIDEQIFNVDEYQINGHTKNSKVLDHCQGGERVLEIGCAPGILLKRLTEYYNIVDGIEVDEKYYEKMRFYAGARPNLKFGFFPSVTKGLVPSDYYDTIISLDVLEHIEDGKAFIDECFRILKPGGHIILMLPINYYDGTLPDKNFLHTEHVWIYTLTGISGLLYKFHDVIYDRWCEGHEIVIARKGI